jgi:hypothetical protein
VARGYAEAAQRVARLFERQGDPVDAAVFTLRDAVAGAEDGTDALTTALGPAVMPWMTREGWEEIAAWFLFSFVLFFFFFFFSFSFFSSFFSFKKTKTIILIPASLIFPPPPGHSYRSAWRHLAVRRPPGAPDHRRRVGGAVRGRGARPRGRARGRPALSRGRCRPAQALCRPRRGCRGKDRKDRMNPDRKQKIFFFFFFCSSFILRGIAPPPHHQDHHYLRGGESSRARSLTLSTVFSS